MTKEELVALMKRGLIMLVTFLVELRVWTGVALAKAYDFLAFACYFVYTAYHSWCQRHQRTVLRPRLLDANGRYFDIEKATWMAGTVESPQFVDATNAFMFAVMFYGWNTKLIKIFMQRCLNYQHRPLQLHLRWDHEGAFRDMLLDLEEEKNLTTHCDLDFGDITVAPDHARVVA